MCCTIITQYRVCLHHNHLHCNSAHTYWYKQFTHNDIIKCQVWIRFLTEACRTHWWSKSTSTARQNERITHIIRAWCNHARHSDQTHPTKQTTDGKHQPGHPFIGRGSLWHTGSCSSEDWLCLLSSNGVLWCLWNSIAHLWEKTHHIVIVVT